MENLEIVLTICALLCCGIANAAPVKKIDQRQDGDLNIQAHLDKIVLLIVPNKNINILDIKGQQPFEHYEDILPLLGKDSNEAIKYHKLNSEDVKIKTLVANQPILPAIESKEEKKETILPASAKPEQKIESKEQPVKEQPPKDAAVKKSEARETTPKKVQENEKSASSTTPDSLKKVTPKSDSRTYQTVLSHNNRERVIAVSNPESEVTKKIDLPDAKAEKL